MSALDDTTGLRIAGESAGGMMGGRAAALSDWQIRREEREANERVKVALRAAGVRRKSPTSIDWSAQPLGVESDAAIARRLGIFTAVVAVARRRAGIAPVTPKRAWTSKEDARLARHYKARGFAALAEIAAELDRTVDAVRQRMAVGLRLPQRHPRPGARGLWPKSIAKLSAEWGYPRSRIETAIKRLGLELERGAIRSRLVTREHAAALRVELARHADGKALRRRQPGEWGHGGADACLDCARSDVPRHASDRCSPCYGRRYREAAPSGA